MFPFKFSPGKRETHKQFDPHPFPGQSREVVYVYWFLLPPNYYPLIAIALAWHRGANWEIHGSAPGSAPGCALGNRGALEGAPAQLIRAAVTYVGRTPKRAYSPKGRSRHLLDSEPLLRTLLRTLVHCKTHRTAPFSKPF